jgi:PIN domain nuclease of toxin-antitoxin system
MTIDRLLLDTCAVIWVALDTRMEPAAIEALSASRRRKVDVAVSPITAWELGLLASRGRLPAAQNPADLFAEFLAQPGMALERLTPTILIDSSYLPGDFHNDPADRIIVATARALDLVVVTRDRAILDYARQGYVRALAC